MSAWVAYAEGELRARALARAHEIGRELIGARDDETPSLATGDAGRAIALTYVSAATGDEALAAPAAEALERALARGEELLTHPFLFAGLAGLSFAAEHVASRLLEPGDDLVEALDPLLLAAAAPAAAPVRYELIYGVVGLGVTALERRHRPAGPVLLRQVLDHLASTAIWSTDGATWHTPPAHVPAPERHAWPEGCYTLGLAHGVAGVTALLARALASGAAPDVAPLLDGAVGWLLAQRRPGTPSSYPRVQARGVSTPDQARIAWCYGDLSVALALLGAATATGRADWRQAAVDLLDGALARPRDLTGVSSATLCHGAAGLAHALARAAQATGHERFLAAARAWLAEALTLPIAPDRADDRSLLDGSAGLALALAAAATPIEPAWDRALLLS